METGVCTLGHGHEERIGAGLTVLWAVKEHQEFAHGVFIVRLDLQVAHHPVPRRSQPALLHLPLCLWTGGGGNKAQVSGKERIMRMWGKFRWRRGGRRVE